MADEDIPEYPVGCLIVSDSPEVTRRMGVVLSSVMSSWEFRKILWTDGKTSLEGVIYLGTFYKPISFIERHPG
jgi:hypothetical protein